MSELGQRLDATGPAAPPRKNGELVFATPWERRLFGVTLALYEAKVYAWDEFRLLLIDEIARWERAAPAGSEYRYYERWERALSTLLAQKGLVAPNMLEERIALFASRPAGHDHEGHEHPEDA